jgi:hypothetical protein
MRASTSLSLAAWAGETMPELSGTDGVDAPPTA